MHKSTASFGRLLRRRGMSAVQTAVVLVLIAVVVFIGVRSMSTNTSTDLETTADGLADPSKLVDRF